MPVIYPERVNDEKFPICECGHADFDHNEYQPTPLNCQMCMCHRFVKETSMNHDEFAMARLERTAPVLAQKLKEIERKRQNSTGVAK